MMCHDMQQHENNNSERPSPCFDTWNPGCTLLPWGSGASLAIANRFYMCFVKADLM